PAGDLASNDSAGPANESGQTLTVISVGAASHGTVSLSNGTVTYTPAQDYNGPDTFSYTIQDNGTTNGAPDFKTATATVSINVTAVNDAPSFTAGVNQTVLEDASTQSVSWATSISAGPADESGQALNFLVSNDNSALFSVQPAISANGTLTYTL